MITARISSKGQITLPKRIRKTLGLQKGEQVIFCLEEDRVVLRPLGPTSAAALAGSLGRHAKRRPAATRIRDHVRKEVARAAAKER